MKSYFARHTDELDIDQATRQMLWSERIFAIHFPQTRDGVFGDFDNESTNPADYPAGAVARYVEVLNEISRDGGYVLAEYYGQTEYLAGRVDPRSPVEVIRGTWGIVNNAPPGKPAVLKGFHLKKYKVVSREEIADLLFVRPARGTLHRWPKAGESLARLVDGEDAETDEVNQYQRAYNVWNELTGYAHAQNSVTYGTLGKLTGIHHRALRYPLEIMEVYCNENSLPPLTILAVAQDTGRPREGFRSWDVADFDTGAAQVYAFDWSTYGNPFAFAANGTRREALERILIADPSKAADVYVLAKVRGTVQMLFRGALLQAYSGACAVSGSTLREGLEAAHLVPWRDASVHERLSVRNGILLTSWHHRLFDAGLLTISQDTRVRVDPRVWQTAAPYDRARLEEIDGIPLRLPLSPAHHPDPELISRRNETLGRKSRLLAEVIARPSS